VAPKISTRKVKEYLNEWSSENVLIFFASELGWSGVKPPGCLTLFVCEVERQYPLMLLPTGPDTPRMGTNC